MKQIKFLLVISLLFLLIGAGKGYTELSVELPRPTGNYKIGTVSLPFIDKERPGIYSNGQRSQYREFMIQIWYPAKIGTNGETSVYYDPITAQFISNFFPAFRYEYGSILKTHAIVGAKITGGHERFPVLLFSPGQGSVYGSYQSILEDLASHGYIVIGVNHPNISAVTVFPDGHYYPYTPSKFDIQPPTTPEELEEYYYHESELLEEAVLDLQCIIKQLSCLDRNPKLPFTGRMKFWRLGCFGHSFGGAASVQTCIKSRAVSAAINMDGALWGDGYKHRIFKPMMLMTPNYSSAQQPVSYEILWNNLLNDSFFIKVQNTGHQNFSDAPLLKLINPDLDLGSIPGLGEIDPNRGLRIIRDSVRRFFDSNLKDASPKRIEWLAKLYPEITVTTKD